jgi:hypothetical protein
MMRTWKRQVRITKQLLACLSRSSKLKKYNP